MRSSNASIKIETFAFTAFAAIVLACAPFSVFAQRGGGHGGGGAHSAGGSSRSVGRSTSGGSFAGRSYRAAPSAPAYSRPSSSYARPGANSYRSAPAKDALRAPTGNPGAAYGRGAASGAASHETPADSQWHSFVPRTVTPDSGSSRSTNAGNVRTFVGEGHDLYEDRPPTTAASAATRSGTVGSASRAVSGTSAASTAFASRSPLTGKTLFAEGGFGGVGIAGGGGWGTFGLGPVAPLFVRPGFGFGFGAGPGFRSAFGFGRFGLGFGFGLGWNPCWGWDDPFCFAGFYGPPNDYGYPPYDPNAYPPQTFGPDQNPDSNYGPGNDSGPPPDSPYSAPAEPANPNWDTSVNAGIAIQPGSVVIYLKDGTSLSPSDYWITDDQLHYTLGGSENTVGMDHVDLRRTNDENAKNGVRFWLKSQPEKNLSPGDAPAASPTPESNDDAAPGPASTPPDAAPPDAAPDDSTPKRAPSAEPL